MHKDDTSSSPGTADTLASAEPPLEDSRPTTSFSTIRLYAENSAAHQARRELIAAARQTLDICYFIVETDASSATLLVDLADAARRGVQVRVLLDYMMTYPHAPMLRWLVQQSPSITVRRYGAPSPTWLSAMRESGIDQALMIRGLTTQNTALIIQSITGAPALADSVAASLRALRLQGENARAFAGQVLGVFREAQRRVMEMLRSTEENEGRALPSIPEIIERFKERIRQLQRRVHVLAELVRGLEAFCHRTHHKLMLADGRNFLMGGRNLSDEYQCDTTRSGKRFRDIDIRATDNGAASEHARAFEALWSDGSSVDLTNPDELDAQEPPSSGLQIADLAATLPPGEEAAASRSLPDLAGYVVNNLSGPQGDTCITRAYIERIARATQLQQPVTIDIVSAYACFQGDGTVSASLLELRNSLGAAAMAGHTVNIYTNSIDTTDLRAVNTVAYQTFAELADQGVHIFELAAGQGSLHAKAAAIGDEWMMIGSYNMDPRSELYDTNNLIVLHDPHGGATTALREILIGRLVWTQLSAQACRQQAEDNSIGAMKLHLLRALL